MKKLLIIEDEPSIRILLEDDFSLEGFQVTTAERGDKGLQLALSDHYDIILLDVMLPGMDGFEVCRQLRKRDINTPIIMLTAKKAALID